MPRTTVTRTISAPVDEVFDTISDIENFAKAVPHITNVEFLTEQQRGVGTRFVETRVLRGRQASSTLEVTEYVENQRVRMVSDEGGTIWDTVFSVRPANTGDGDPATELELVMEATAYKFTSKLINPLMKGIIRRAIEGDMDAVKAYCEANS